ncbi:MAG: translocation/assembly module TamB domain-containing protein [Candidatus Adiutrix sp.]|nr:translocation/assembly module TamB domain-containing protein [Candidatus Adiutrix sp.]
MTKKILKAAALGLALVLIVLAGAIVWLRTTSGADFIGRQAAGLLAASGLSLTVGSIDGPLPERLALRQVQLADDQGPLLKADLVEVKLKPWALWNRQVHVPLIKLENPELIRLPAGEGQDQPGGPVSLPVDIRLDELAVTGGLIRPEVLAGLGLPLAPPLALAVHGGASLEGRRGSIDLKLDIHSAGVAEIVDGLQLTLTGGGSLEDWQTRLETQIRPGEVVALPAEVAALLKPELNLAATLTGGLNQPFRAKIDRADTGQLALAGQVSFRPDEAAAAQSELEADLQVRLADLAALAPDLAGSLDLTVNARGRLNDVQGQVMLTSPRITAATGAMVGPLALETGWRFQQAGESPLVTVTGLVARLAGLNLAGQLNALLGPEPRLEGTLEADIADWAQLAALSGQPLSGEPVKLKINLAAPEGRQAAEVSLNVPYLRLAEGQSETLALRQTSLEFKAGDLFGRPDLDLQLALGPGLAGPLTWKSGAATVKGLGGQGQFTAEVAQAKMSGAIGGGAKDGLKLAGQYDLDDQPVIDLERLNLMLGPSGLNLREPLRLRPGPEWQISPLIVDFRPQGQLAAEVDLRPEALKIKASLKNLPYLFFKPLAGPDLPGGEIQSLTVALEQTADGPAGDLKLKTQAAPKELKKLRPILELNGHLSGGPTPALALEGTIAGGPGWKADGRFTARLPLTPGPAGGWPQPNLGGPLAGDLKFTGPLGPLWALLGQPDQTLSGLAQIQTRLSGSLNQPQTEGAVYLAGGRFEDRLLGLLIKDINLEAVSTPEWPLKALLAAKDNRGGGLALEAQVRDLANPVIKAKGRLSHFSPLNRDDLVIFISGDLGAEGPLSQLNLSSDLTIDRGEMDLKIISAAGSVSTLDLSQSGDKITSANGGLRLNLKVRLPGQFFIRGPGLESEWQGQLAIGGSSSRPSLVGQLSPVRGYFEFSAKQFQFSGGEIAFNGGVLPSLNLELTNSTPDLTAIIRAGGSAKKPTLTLESRPPLPEEEVLAHVLFGQNSSSISRFEALQLASALNDLRHFGAGGWSALGTVRSSLGLDVLRLGGSGGNNTRQVSSQSGSMARDMSGRQSGDAAGTQDEDIAVEAGKYLSDNVYMGVEHSGSGGAAVRLEVELTPSVSLEARSSAESSRVGLGWKKDY